MEQSNLTSPLASISSTNNEYRQQLLILGNGFDLACGLDSTYNDFFDFIFRKGWTNNYWYDIFETLSNDNSLTTNNWSDIETRILLELQNIEFLYEKKIFQIGNYLDRENQIEDEINDYFSNNSENIFFKPTSIIKTTQTIMNRFEKLPPISIVQEELIEDLSTVEFDFCSFLEYQIKIAETEKDTPFQFHKNRHEKYYEYYKKSILLVSYIIRHYSGVEGSLDKLYDIIDSIPTLSSFDELKKRIGNLQYVQSENKYTLDLPMRSSMLSFNYTNPFDNASIRNIHGDLESGNIVFGIDYDKLIGNFNHPPTIFSKSYRILKNGNLSGLEISSNLDFIKFYGHGLGKADYSYFQAIFDTVDLYHSNVTLIFYWSAYNKDKEKQIYNDNVMKVVNLIEEYGKTFTNQDHGRNLLTKLQLENRLILEKIDLDLLNSNKK
jgi:hypothetical protein